MRVLAAMSGGVDSAVAAARAVDAGHDVTGVHLALSANPLSYRSGARGCCTLEDARDARRAADILGIPFYVWDLAERFRADVVDDFVSEYAAGRTPNPCVRCNERIKFAAVLDRALALGFDAVCTGHYARLFDGSGGSGWGGVGSGGAGQEGDGSGAGSGSRSVELHRAVDPEKDQSYVLGVLTAEQLSHAMFPLGDSYKREVRAEAADRGLAVADKPDSHDICFIADGDTAGFLRGELGARPGTIVDEDGSVLARHDASYAFTVGQRRGLGLDQPAADGRRRYVLSIEPVSRTVTVGPHERLAVGVIHGVRPRWCESPPTGVLACGVQIRAHGEEFPARAWLDSAATSASHAGSGGRRGADDDGGPGLRVELTKPAPGVAPGQSVVLYAGTRVVGSATISSTAPADVAVR